MRLKSNLYKDNYGNIFFFKTIQGERIVLPTPRLSLHSYKNIDLKFIGLGLGLSGVLARNLTIFKFGKVEKLFIYPNAHIRLGPKNFNLQAGVSDRYHNIYNPMVAHLSLGLKNNLRIGVTNQTPDFPLMTVSFFLSDKNKYFIFGPSGFSYGSKFSF